MPRCPNRQSFQIEIKGRNWESGVEAVYFLAPALTAALVTLPAILKSVSVHEMAVE